MDRQTNEKTKKYELKDGQNRTYLYNGDIVSEQESGNWNGCQGTTCRARHLL